MILALASVINYDCKLMLQIVASLTIVKVMIIIVLLYRPLIATAMERHFFWIEQHLLYTNAWK